MTNSKRRKLIKRLLIIAVSLIAAVLIGLLAAVVSVRQFASSEKIAPNVTIGGAAVGGLSQQEALAVVQEQLLPRLPAQIELTYPGGSCTVAPQRLGATVLLQQATAEAYQIAREGGIGNQLVTRLWLLRDGIDVPLTARVDEPQLRRALINLAPDINREPRDAEVSVVDEEVQIIPGQTGVSLQVEASIAALRLALTNPWCRQIQLAVEVQPPAIAAEALADIEVVLSSYSTPFNPGQVGRTHNLELAMARINETVVEPGEEFSLNKVVGPRLTEEGYRSAPIFREGEVVPETGGGVCQVASTMYNAALLANLEILERHHHSRPVVYCPAGHDATVYYGQLDMRFRNSLSYSILILGGIEGNRLWAKILGKKEDDYDVKLVRADIAKLSFGIKEISDPELEAGQEQLETPGRGGLRVTLFREVHKDGELIKRQRMHTDVYRPQTKVVRVGTKPLEAPAERPGGPSLAPRAPTLPPVEVPPEVESGSRQ